MLEGLVAGKPFEFDTLSEGLKQYLFYAETALRTASNNGEMPVIGKDLQAGADFMGLTRKNIDDFIEANGDVSTVGPARDYLTTELGKALGIPVNGPEGIQVGFTCNTYIVPPELPTATATAPASATTDKQYVYKVVSTYKDPAKPGDTDHDSAPSEVSEPVTNAATLNATTAYNTVSWMKRRARPPTRSSAPPRPRPPHGRRARPRARDVALRPPRPDRRDADHLQGLQGGGHEVSRGRPADQALPHPGGSLRRRRRGDRDRGGDPGDDARHRRRVAGQGLRGRNDPTPLPRRARARAWAASSPSTWASPASRSRPARGAR